MEMIKTENVSCNLCYKDDAAVLFSRRDSLTHENTLFSVVQCRNCGLVYVNPRPTLQCIQNFYTKQFLSYQLELYDFKNSSIKEKLVSLVAKSSATARVKTIQNFFKSNGKLKLLDIGCGKGHFLYAAKKRLNCNVTGIDFDQISVTYCQDQLGLNVRQGNANSLIDLGTEFDLVTMWHFLEHEFDPASTLKTVNAQLKKGKYLVIEVPNADSLENLLFGENSYLYDVPRHLYNFSPTTITRYLEHAGFKVEKIKFSYYSGGWVGTLQQILFNGKVFRNLKDNIFLFLVLSQLIFPIDFILSKSKKGSIMTVLAKKENDLPIA